MPLFAVVFKRKTKACTVGRPYTSWVRVLISAWPVVTVMVSSSALVFFWCLEHGFGSHPSLKRGLHLQRQDWKVEVPWAGTCLQLWWLDHPGSRFSPCVGLSVGQSWVTAPSVLEASFTRGCFLFSFIYAVCLLPAGWFAPTGPESHLWPSLCWFYLECWLSLFT